MTPLELFLTGVVIGIVMVAITIWFTKRYL